MVVEKIIEECRDRRKIIIHLAISQRMTQIVRRRKRKYQ